MDEDIADDHPHRGRGLSPTLSAFLESWQPRQRRAAGMQALLFRRIDGLERAHPEWAGYDLITHVLGALHLIIEGDRLAGGQTRSQVIAELSGLVAHECPGDEPADHRAVATAVIDLLMNVKERHARLREAYMRSVDGVVDHPELSFRLIRATGDEFGSEPTLKATPEAINIFQNLFTFDPSDRAAAERYRSERMLERRDYDEVLYSVERRATSVHALRGDIEALIRRIRYSVADVDYAADAIPLLDETLVLIRDQIDAEEKFAESVAEHTHHQAPDLPRLQRITAHLHALIHSLTELHASASTVKSEFEEQQDRQLFTYRRLTVNPQSDLFEPLLSMRVGDVRTALAAPAAVFLSVRPPRILNLQALADRMAPARKAPQPTQAEDPFDFGDVRPGADDLDPTVLTVIQEVLGEVSEPVGLSELLATIDDRAVRHEMAFNQRALLPWALAVVVAGAYSMTDKIESGAAAEVFDHARLAVVNPARRFRSATVSGDDLLVLPRDRPATSDNEETTWTR